MSTMMIERPAPSEYAPFYAGYVASVPDGDLVRVLEQQREETLTLFRGIDQARAGHRYAPGKWSIADVLGHVTDAERVFTYRALTFARGDTSALPSFDEDAWAVTANAGRRPLRSLIDEYSAVRASTIELFRNLTPEECARSGIASTKPISVRALAYIIAGHERHHLRILRERYLG